MLPVVFNVETDVTSMLAALRIIPGLYLVLMLFSVRRKARKPMARPTAHHDQAVSA
jgi:hypothetical protein